MCTHANNSGSRIDIEGDRLGETQRLIERERENLCLEVLRRVLKKVHCRVLKGVFKRVLRRVLRRFLQGFFEGFLEGFLEPTLLNKIVRDRSKNNLGHFLRRF